MDDTMPIATITSGKREEKRAPEEQSTQQLQIPRLPLVPLVPKEMRTPSSEGPMRSSTKAQRQKRRILVIDDERDYRTIVQDQLDSDYEIYTVENGNEALSVLERMYRENNPPVVIITDKMMPIMDGDEFIVEARKITNGLKFIMITSNTSITDDMLVDGGKPDRLIYKICLSDLRVLRNAIKELIDDSSRGQGEE